MKKKHSKIKLIIIEAILIILYMYALWVSSFPDTITLFEDEDLVVETLWGTSINVNDGNENKEESENKKVSVKLFDVFNLKTIDINTIKNTQVVPVGNIGGIKIYTNGVLVVGMSEINAKDNVKVKPYQDTGIEEGDMIIAINEENVYNTKELTKKVNESKGEALDIVYVKNGEEKECKIIPAMNQENEYKLGLWVRDSAAGVGTITFYNPDQKTFAALGHGITDIDTGELIEISGGEFVTTNIIKTIKGEAGVPGKIQGSLNNDQVIGKISKNTEYGIYGTVDNIAMLKVNTENRYNVALRGEIKEGKATILCNLDNQRKEYEIKIEKIYLNNYQNNKSMLVKVTDQELLEKTGGIVQGMSGSPIIQNGKFAGAITHVLVNDPTTGYGVFADMMLKQMN